MKFKTKIILIAAAMLCCLTLPACVRDTEPDPTPDTPPTTDIGGDQTDPPNDDPSDNPPDDPSDNPPDDPPDNPPDDPPDNPPDNPPDDPPTEDEIIISGADDKEILRGKYFDCYAGVTAVKGADDLTAQITVVGSVNTAKAGMYTLKYTVTDGDETAEATRKITVKENAAIGKEKPVPVYTLESGADYNIAKGCETYSNSALNNPAYATDGDLSTRWESVHGVDSASLTVNLGAPLAVNSVKIYWEAAYAESFSILVSNDGKEWREIEKVENQTLTPDIVSGRQLYLNSFGFKNLTAQYIRLSGEKRKSAYGYSVYEFEVFGPTGTAIPKEEYPDLFDAEKEGSPDWAVAHEEYLSYDLGAVKQVDTLRLAFKGYLTPASYRVLYAGTDGEYKELKLKNLPYSADTFSFAGSGDERLTVSARYFKIEMAKRRFYISAYRVTEVEFRLGSDKIAAQSASASSEKNGHSVALTLDGSDETFWENDNDNLYQTIDLGAVKAVGRVDLIWRGDDGGKGKYYDLEISEDGESWTTVFRQTHGATQRQSVYIYADARYIRIKDYQSPDGDRYMLEGALVCSQYPETSGEGKVNYDISQPLPELEIIKTENGSYITGVTDFPSARMIAYLDDSLRGKPVPSNDWWQGLLIADKGYNMFMNPLTATFRTDGLWLTNPGEGYFDGFLPGNGSQTVDVDARDIAIGYAGMSANAEVRVTGYSDYGVSAVMTDDKEVDKLTVFLSEGTLYAYCIFAEPEKAQLSAENFVAFYDLEGNKILADLGAAYTGDGIVAVVRTHAGYEGGVRKYLDSSGGQHENAATYEERYFVVSVPANTRFLRGESAVSIVMTDGNYLSLGAVSEKDCKVFPKTEVKTLHEHGYAFVTDTSCLFSFDGETNAVTTEFRLKTTLMREGFSAEAYSAYLPHQLAKSTYKGGSVYRSVRGDCRSHIGNLFTTRDTFYGVVPTFVEPTDDGYSSSVLYDQLLMLYNGNGGDKKPADSNLISGDPYWQGKNLHPMAMAALAADQIGATDLRDKFLDKIEYILTDWFTYDPVKDAATGAYFYYDSEWGTLYYKNSEFGAGVNLADHYFTFGYYTLAAGVLTSFRPGFATEWGDMIELLIRDYMNPSRDDELFPYMRNFDPFSGHGWAGGYADNNGGNNQESAGEALNSWVGAYLYATAVGNEEVRLAAIYGYTTELAAIKHYWFDYFGDFPESYPFGVAGQVYGASNFYGTFFNGQPLFMYGIHLIPGEEYLTSYALNADERVMLEGMIDKMREEQASWDVSEAEKDIYAWQHIFIPIVAIYDPDEAISWYEEVLEKQGNVGNDSEQFNVYYLIHGMKSTGLRTTDIWAENGASATVYERGGKYTALCWNPTEEEKTIVFRNASGVTGSAKVPAHRLVSCDPTKTTEEFESYTPVSDFDLKNDGNLVNSSIVGGQLKLGNNGSAEYKVTFGSEQSYYGVKIKGGAGVKLYIDGKELPLTITADGLESEPVALSFKHTVKIVGSNATVSDVKFEKLTLKKTEVAKEVTASSEKDGNIAANIFDGNMETRWESRHGSDDEWLEIKLDEPTLIYQMRIYWQAASAKEYKVYFSGTGEDWTEVYHGVSSQEARTDAINPTTVMRARYIRIECISRAMDFGYSIYEIELFNFDEPVTYIDATEFDFESAVVTDQGAVRIDFGGEPSYYSLNITGGGESVKAFVGDAEIKLAKTVGGWASEPFATSGKHALRFVFDGAISDIELEKLTLNKVNAQMTATASSENGNSSASLAVDGNLSTRWESEHGNDDEWFEIELSEDIEIYQLKINWEAASAKEYKVYFSETGDNWTEVYHGVSSQGARTDEISPSEIMRVGYIRVECLQRTTAYGYSIYEIELYNFNNLQGAN